MKADNIIVMDRGKIVETVLNEDLLKNINGRYQKLYQAQLKKKIIIYLTRRYLFLIFLQFHLLS